MMQTLSYNPQTEVTAYTMAEISDILLFWFGDGNSIEQINAQKQDVWWSKNADVDAEILKRFKTVTEKIFCGELDEWQQTPEGLVACILCLDQFPRNMYRGTPRSFRYDAGALSLARKLVAAGWHKSVGPLQRVFGFLPFEHSESLADQNTSLKLYDELRNQADEKNKALFDGFCEFAEKHHAVIAKFGRFPHRNAILGRQSTAGEIQFLEQPGSSF